MNYAQWREKYVDGVEKDNMQSGVNNTFKNETGNNKDVQIVGRIDRSKFEKISKDIRTDEVVLTDERKRHINIDKAHPNSYDKYGKFIFEIVANPDRILKDRDPEMAILLKKVDGNYFRLILWLATKNTDVKYKNSVITFFKIDLKEWKRYRKNAQTLYIGQDDEV